MLMRSRVTAKGQSDVRERTLLLLRSKKKLRDLVISLKCGVSDPGYRTCLAVDDSDWLPVLYFYSWVLIFGFCFIPVPGACFKFYLEALD